MFSRVLFSGVVCLCLAAGSLIAHDPHDPIVTVAVSPNFAQDSTIYAATDYLSIKLGVYALLKSTNGGVTWSAVGGLPNVAEMWAIAFSPAYGQDQTIYVAGAGGLYMTTNQGTSWTLASTLSLLNVALSPNFATDNTLFIVTASMTVFESANRGQTFTQIALPGSITSALSVMAVSPNFDVDGTLLLGTASNGIYESTNGGSSWVSVTPAQPSPAVTSLVFSPGFSSDQTAFAGTAAGVLISSNAGASWSASNSGLSDTGINSITLSPNYLQDSTIWVATADTPPAVGGVFQSVNQGASWTGPSQFNRELSPLTTSHYHNVAAGLSASGITLILATYEGLWISPSGAISWQYIDTIPTRLVRHIFLSPNYVNDTTLFADTYGGGNAWSTNGGGSWTFKNTGLRLPYLDAAAISTNFANDQTAFSATASGLERTINGGATYTPMAMLGALTHVRGLAVSPNFAQDGTVLIGTDLEPASTYPATVTYQGQQYPNQGLFVSTNQGNNWIPTSLGGPPVDSIAISPGFASDRTAFAASCTHGLYKSTDGGMTWTSITTPGSPKLGVVAVSPAFPTDQTVYIAPYTGGLLKSTNGGSTWTLLSRTNKLVVLDLQLSPNYVNDQTFFAATLQSGVMKSTNGGTTLLPLSAFPDQFATAVAISPNFANDKTVFAAAYHSIYKSQSAGSTWTDTVPPARIEESRTVDSDTTGQPPPTISYQGSWVSTSSPNASTSTYMTSTTSQNTAVLNFTGTGVRWVSLTGPGQGTATVLLDGVLQATVLLTAPTTHYQQVVWVQQGLPCVPHTVTITATPISGFSVTLDAFDIWINACPEANETMHGH